MKRHIFASGFHFYFTQFDTLNNGTVKMIFITLHLAFTVKGMQRIEKFIPEHDCFTLAACVLRLIKFCKHYYFFLRGKFFY